MSGCGSMLQRSGNRLSDPLAVIVAKIFDSGWGHGWQGNRGYRRIFGVDWQILRWLVQSGGNYFEWPPISLRARSSTADSYSRINCFAECSPWAMPKTR